MKSQSSLTNSSAYCNCTNWNIQDIGFLVVPRLEKKNEENKKKVYNIKLIPPNQIGIKTPLKAIKISLKKH